MIVDHNKQRLSVRAYLLHIHGYRVIQAESPAAALDVLADTRPGVLDLLIAELLMPSMEGSELAWLAKWLHPDLPVLLTSDSVVAFDRIGTAADAFLPKGANSPAEMLARVKILTVRKRGPKSKQVSQ